jgi:lysyl-tRNA synthetase class 2
MKVRQDKHQELNGGSYPLTTQHLHWTIASVLKFMSVSQVVTSLTPTELPSPMTVHGRISLLRKSGGITFLKLTDASDSIQLIATKAVLADYDKLKLLDLGDIIEIDGQICLSKTGEQSLLVNKWTVLTKAHRSPPEKHAGIADQELKYRKRYLDLMSDEESRNRFKVRSMIIRGIRSWMESQDFMEVETSTLNTISSGAAAKPFTTHHNALDMELFMRIAPELYLKRLLVGGYEKVYEIGRNYRNEGISTRHNPEFTMMEFYQAYGRFSDLILYAKALLRLTEVYCQNNLTGSALEYFNKCKAERPFTLDKFVEVPMFDAVLAACKLAGIELEYNINMFRREVVNDSGEPFTISNVQIVDTNNARLQTIDLKGMFYALSEAPTLGHKINILFEFVVEPFLTQDYRSDDGKYSLPVFITEYPKDICPLARANDQKPFVCDRYELFIEGRELCNAFQELNDPDEQAARFQEQLDEEDEESMDFDQDYVEALEHGMPPAIGFGMGIDRLVMLMTNSQSIKDVILFPTLKPKE